MTNKFLDLTTFFNHGIFENEKLNCLTPSEKMNRYGVAGIHITEHLPSIFCFDGVNYLIDKEPVYNYDNIACDGQLITVDSIVSSLFFLGFCEYGTVLEQITIYGNGKYKNNDLILKTFHSNAVQGIDNLNKNNICKNAVRLRGDDGQKHNFYCWAIPVSEGIIDVIELPVNLSMHILSISFK